MIILGTIDNEDDGLRHLLIEHDDWLFIVCTYTALEPNKRYERAAEPWPNCIECVVEMMRPG